MGANIKTQYLKITASFLGVALIGITIVLLTFFLVKPTQAMADNVDTNNDNVINVYRLYNPWSGEHLLTSDANEVVSLITNDIWKDEGVAFKAFAQPSQTSQSIPVYRLYNTILGDHLYTIDKNEVNCLKDENWINEGENFYVSKSKTDFPVFRLYNHLISDVGKKGSHLWTLDKNEYDTLPNIEPVGAWRQENIAWYAAGSSDSESHIKPLTPVGTHGSLKVQGTNLIDQNGDVVQLRGVSTHGLAWYPQYVSYESFKTLRDDWKANCVRLAMYTAEYNGYCTGGDQDYLKDLIRKGVKAADDLGMYVIVDWHILNDQSPTTYESQARDFFNTMSNELKNHNNVIYEICNEPNGWADWNTIKGYAERIIPVIRANDPDAVVIVGTPQWSQLVNQAAANPLTGACAENTMYALHFYAATHTDWLRNTMTQALNAGLPIFISEYGTCDASGNGGNDFYQASQWIDLANSKRVSWCAWNLSNKSETSALIAPWCNKTSSWDPWELSESGQWVRNRMIAALLN